MFIFLSLSGCCKQSNRKRNFSAILDFLCDFRMVIVMAELIKYSRNVVFKYLLLFQVMTTQQQLILYLLICLLLEHLPKETFFAQILGEWLFFVPVPLFSFKGKYLRKDKKCMFLIAFQVFFINYCYYSYCYRVRGLGLGTIAVCPR